MFIRPQSLVLSLGLLAILTSTTRFVQAQETPKATATRKDAAAPGGPPAGFNPLGDPSKFTRMGGWGGFGGAIGQFGMGKAMLIMTPAVQKELKLTEKQKKDLQDWSEALRKRGETMFRNQGPGQAQPPQGGEGPAPGPGPGGGPPPGFNPLAMIEMVTTLVNEGETSLAKILDKKQSARLTQISLQMEGAAALGRADVAEAMYLSDDQILSIQEILKDTQNNRMGYMLKQMVSMRGRRNGPGQPAADAAQTKTARAAAPAKDVAKEPVDEDPEAIARRRAADRQRREGELTRFREGFDKIQDESTAKILRLLDRRQIARFEKLLGEPFDASKLSGAGGFGGMGGPGGPRPDAEAANPQTPAKPAPAPARSSRLRDLRGGGSKKDPD
jgi:hypothetical protein